MLLTEECTNLIGGYQPRWPPLSSAMPSSTTRPWSRDRHSHASLLPVIGKMHAPAINLASAAVWRGASSQIDTPINEQNVLQTTSSCSRSFHSCSSSHLRPWTRSPRCVDRSDHLRQRPRQNRLRAAECTPVLGHSFRSTTSWRVAMGSAAASVPARCED